MPTFAGVDEALAVTWRQETKMPLISMMYTIYCWRVVLPEVLPTDRVADLKEVRKTLFVSFHWKPTGV